MILKNGTYDILKWICIVFLPALATLIGAIFMAWRLPYATPILETIAAVETFLGTLIGISHYNYYKGEAQDGDQD